MPTRGSVSVWTPTDLKSINPLEPYEIRILGRVLDLVMQLPESDILPISRSRRYDTAPEPTALDFAGAL